MIMDFSRLDHADALRYRTHFSHPDKVWPLWQVEFEVAQFIFSNSPTLRTIPDLVDTLFSGLRVGILVDWAGDDSKRRLLVGAALCVITIPHLARAYFDDPQWSDMVAELDTAELHVLASARAVRQVLEGIIDE